MLLIGAPMSAFAQSQQPTRVPGAGDVTCIATISTNCVLRASYLAMEMVRDGAAGMVVSLKGVDSQSGAAKSESIYIDQDLISRVEMGRLSSDEAAIVTSELSSLEGSVYQIPSFEELTKALGFPKDAFFTEDDLKVFVSVHLQLTWGIGTVTASYLSNRMGVSVISAYKGGVRIAEEPKSAAAAAVPAPAPAAQDVTIEYAEPIN